MTGGVPITREEFDAQLERYSAALDEGGAGLTADDHVAMVRLWNTIKWRPPAGSEALAAEFEAQFFPREIETVTNVLDLTPSKGMALYSRERDLYLGGPPHANSLYEIVPG